MAVAVAANDRIPAKGATSTIEQRSPHSIGKFQRGCAHLALGVLGEQPIGLPVAIAAAPELNARDRKCN